MQQAEFFNEIEDVLGVDKGTISSNTNVVDQPYWDSMAIMSFMAMVEEKFGIVLNNEQIKQANTFGDLSKLVDGHVSQ